MIQTVQEKLEWLICVWCNAKYIEDCIFAKINADGKIELPGKCYRSDLIKITPKPKKEDDI